MVTRGKLKKNWVKIVGYEPKMRGRGFSARAKKLNKIYYFLVLVCRKYGGYDNASTDCETTNFYFEIPRFVLGFFLLYIHHGIVARFWMNLINVN